VKRSIPEFPPAFREGEEAEWREQRQKEGDGGGAKQPANSPHGEDDGEVFDIRLFGDDAFAGEQEPDRDPEDLPGLVLWSVTVLVYCIFS
jgi:hypothetical protein